MNPTPTLAGMTAMHAIAAEPFLTLATPANTTVSAVVVLSPGGEYFLMDNVGSDDRAPMTLEDYLAMKKLREITPRNADMIRRARASTPPDYFDVEHE